MNIPCNKKLIKTSKFYLTFYAMLRHEIKPEQGQDEHKSPNFEIFSQFFYF